MASKVTTKTYLVKVIATEAKHEYIKTALEAVVKAVLAVMPGIRKTEIKEIDL